MKVVILLVLLICNSGYSQSLEIQKDYFKSNLNTLVDETGNNIFNSNSNDSIVFIGENSDDHYFGFSLAEAGDVNGDGFSDMIIGSPYADDNGMDKGKAYIFLGGIVMNNIADITFKGEASNNYFGWSVDGAGDLNGDGYSDVIISALFTVSTGKIYVYYGGQTMNNIADLTMLGEFSGVRLGSSLSSAGDVNNDGYSDIIAGAPSNSNDRGKAFIYYGGTSMDNNADV